MQTLTITLQKLEKEKLSKLALRYGLSLPEFSRQVLVQLNDSFEKESFADYKNSKKLKSSFQRALKDFHDGRIQSRL